MSTKAKKITQRVISAFMAALLCSMLWMDGHVKAAIIAQENPGLSTAVGAVAAAASPASEPATTSQPDTGSDIQEQVDKAYAALDSLKATTDDSDRMTYYRNNGIDLVKEVLSTVITNEPCLHLPVICSRKSTHLRQGSDKPAAREHREDWQTSWRNRQERLTMPYP